MFKQFNKQILPKLNMMWSKVDGLLRMRSDNYINIQRAGNGTTLSLNIEEVRRKVSQASTDTKPRIFQVRSIADPTFQFGDDLSRVGIYSCVEMVVNNKVTDNSSGWESPAYSFWDSRMTDKQGVIDGSYDQSNTDDYAQWNSIDNYVPGKTREVKTTYTDSDSGRLWEVSHIYTSIQSGTNKPPATNPDFWLEITVEVMNICESFRVTGSHTDGQRYAKLSKFDTIIANDTIDNTGIRRWAGSDTIGATRLFISTGDFELGDIKVPLCNIIYNSWETNPDQAEEGELNYNIEIRNFVDTGSPGQNIRWDGVEREVQATWFNGIWVMSPTIAFGVSPVNGVEVDSFNRLAVVQDLELNSLSIESDEKLGLDGGTGDTFIRHNSADGEVEHTVEGDQVTTW